MGLMSYNVVISFDDKLNLLTSVDSLFAAMCLLVACGSKPSPVGGEGGRRGSRDVHVKGELEKRLGGLGLGRGLWLRSGVAQKI